MKRDVLIDDDGSGSIDVADIGGNFTVSQKSSGGSIDYARVSGRCGFPSAIVSLSARRRGSLGASRCTCKALPRHAEIPLYARDK